MGDPTLLDRLDDLLDALKEQKPNDRSEIDRRFAIAITEAEKLKAYIALYCTTQ